MSEVEQETKEKAKRELEILANAAKADCLLPPYDICVLTATIEISNNRSFHDTCALASAIKEWCLSFYENHEVLYNSLFDLTGGSRILLFGSYFLEDELHQRVEQHEIYLDKRIRAPSRKFPYYDEKRQTYYDDPLHMWPHVSWHDDTGGIFYDMSYNSFLWGRHGGFNIKVGPENIGELEGHGAYLHEFAKEILNGAVYRKMINELEKKFSKIHNGGFEGKDEPAKR
jgi:hypothetical protein